MKEIHIFLSDDGKEFSDGKSCAEYELSDPSVREELTKAISSEYRSVQQNWCGGGACACMGCINSAVQEAGFTKYHWQVWMEKYRGENQGKWSDYDECQVVVTDFGPNLKEVLLWLKLKTCLPYADIIKRVESGKFVISSDTYYKYAREIMNELESMGAKVEVCEFDKSNYYI